MADDEKPWTFENQKLEVVIPVVDDAGDALPLPVESLSAVAISPNRTEVVPVTLGTDPGAEVIVRLEFGVGQLSEHGMWLLEVRVTKDGDPQTVFSGRFEVRRSYL
ncbi:MAG: hypothetical protein AAFU66_07820 [Pseudomonadota bacterium]